MDDESILEKKWTEKHPPPRSWTRVDSPPYTYCIPLIFFFFVLNTF